MQKKKKNGYKSLSYKFLFYDKDNVRSQAINFLKKYGALYNLLEDLVTSKINIDDANADQIIDIINLMREDEKMICLIKKYTREKTFFGKMKFLIKQKKFFTIAKKSKKKDKEFLCKNF